MAKVLNYRVLIAQGLRTYWFRLSREEFEAIPKDEYNFAWFAWADYELSPSKKSRFNRLFRYENGDFRVLAVNHTIKRD